MNYGDPRCKQDKQRPQIAPTSNNFLPLSVRDLEETVGGHQRYAHSIAAREGTAQDGRLQREELGAAADPDCCSQNGRRPPDGKETGSSAPRYFPLSHRS